jgi:fatty acid desaturase
MTTIIEPNGVSFREFALMRLSTMAKSKAKGVRENRERIQASAFLAILRVVLHLAGFVLLTVAGFEWNMIAGLVIAGASCFVLSTLFTATVPERSDRA